MHVLVVDDNHADVFLVSQRLQDLYPDAPWRIECFNDGTTTIDHVRRHVGEPMLILCDEHMASLRGSDVLETLRREGLAESVRFVLLSGRPLPSYPEAAGASRRRKPDDLAGYDALLRDIIEEWSAAT